MGVNELTEYLKTAFEYKNSGNYKQAIDYFYKALAAAPESTEIMSELASLYAKLCRYDRAVSFYEQILQKDAENLDAKFELAMLLKTAKDYKRAEKILLDLYNAGYNIEKTAQELFYLLVCSRKFGKIITSFNKYSKEFKNSSVLYYAAIAHSALGNKNTADEYFKKSFKSDEKNILPGIEIAESFFRKGRLDEARALALKLLKYSEDARICSLLAEIEYAEGSIDNAVKYYSYAVRINPQKAEYYYKIGLVFSLKGFFKEAEESLCKAVSLDSANEEYNYALAYMYYVTGKYDLAEKLADFILDINPDSQKAAALKILILSSKNKLQSAFKLIEKLEKSTIKDDFAYYALSVYYEKFNLRQKAADAVSEALRINKNSLEYNYQLAKLDFELGKLQAAEVITGMLLEKNPGYIQAYFLAAKISLEKKNYDKALEYIDKAAELDKNMPECYEIPAEIYTAQEKYGMAAEEYKSALSIAPDNEKYYAKIAECLYKLKNYSEAYLYYKEASELNITKAEYRFNAAKCAELSGSLQNAASDYYMAKRLAPNNAFYIKQYAEFLYKTGNKKEALQQLKNLKKQLSGSEKETAEIEKLIKKYK